MRMAAVWLAALAVAACVGLSDAKLVQVHTLVRHGNRAPNPEVVRSCPALFPSLQSIYDMFGVRPAELTRAGLNQCYIVGDMLREQYIVREKLMEAEYTPESVEWYFQARGETRHQQSMSAILEALFPAGSGLSTYPKRMQPVPYFSWDKSMDPILHPPKLCQACRFRDDARWTATKGASTVAANMAKVDTIGRACGFNITSARVPSAALKDIADGFGFLTYEGMAIPGLKDWDSLNHMVTQFSYDMFVDRLFGTSEQATYWTGDYVRNVVTNMLQAVNRKLDERGDPARKFLLYTASRELLFGVEFFFGLNFDIPQPNTPRGAMPPGDAISIELHMSDTKPDSYSVQIWNMFPPGNDADAVVKANANGKRPYKRQSYKIAGCSSVDCPLDEFISIIKSIEAKTGTWQKICTDYTFTELAAEFPLVFGAGKPAAGKHAPGADRIGPPPGVHDSLSHPYTRAEIANDPVSAYAAVSLKPLGPIVKPVTAAPIQASKVSSDVVTDEQYTQLVLDGGDQPTLAVRIPIIAEESRDESASESSKPEVEEVPGTNGVQSRDVASLSVPTPALAGPTGPQTHYFAMSVAAVALAVAVAIVAWYKRRQNARAEYEAVGLGSVEPFPAAHTAGDE